MLLQAARGLERDGPAPEPDPQWSAYDLSPAGVVQVTVSLGCTTERAALINRMRRRHRHPAATLLGRCSCDA